MIYSSVGTEIKNMEMLEYKTVEDNEKDFQDAYDKFWHQSTNPIDQKRQWDKMFLSVSLACLNICKRICAQRKVIRQDLEEVAMDATAYCMKFIAKGVHPNKLSSYCYLRCRKFIDLPDTVFWDNKVVNFDHFNGVEEEEYGD